MAILTDDKIEVSLQMMQDAGMLRGSQYGVPVEPKQPALGLRWKALNELTDADYERIEQYFLLKINA